MFKKTSPAALIVSALAATLSFICSSQLNDVAGGSRRSKRFHRFTPLGNLILRQGKRIVQKGGAFAIVLTLCALPNSLHAQTAASVSGTVSDTSGAVITGARVDLRSADTNVDQLSVTNRSGGYSFISVGPGRYSITVTKEGFGAVTEDNIVLNVNQAAIVNLVAAPGAVQQTVTVASSASEVHTSTAGLGTVINTRLVNDLPLNGRNFTQILELTPGVSRISVGQNAVAASSLVDPIGQFTFPAVNGQRNRSNMFYLDGAIDLGTYKGTYNYEPIVDAIQEFKVQSHNDLAESGGVTGGIINVATKSGTNTLHGSAWEFLRNSNFDSHNYFQPVLNPLHQNQFGASVGGPVLIPHIYNGKNKTFFFFAYESFRQTQSSQSLITTATSDQLNGDFGADLAKGIVIYNPFSTRPDPANPGSYLRDPFPGNQIPANLLSPAALTYASVLFPAATLSGNPGGNASIYTPVYTDADNFTARVDQALGQRDQFYVRFSHFNQPYTLAEGSPVAVQKDKFSGYNIAAHELHVFGPSTVLDLIFARNYGRNILQSSFPGAPEDFTQTLIANGFSSSFIGDLLQPVGQTIPAISVAGYLSTGAGNAYQDPSSADNYEYAAALSKILGRHSFKIGGNFTTNNFAQAVVSASESTSTFQTSNLEQPTNPVTGKATGDAMAAFLLGVPSAGSRRNSLEVDHSGWIDGAYLQDQIRLTPKLSLNVGVRWDVSIWPLLGDATRGIAYAGDMDLSNGTYILSGVPPACSSTVGAPCIPGGTLPANVVLTSHKNGGIHKDDYSSWQPRIGFAYQVHKNTSIHAGYGRFYDNWSSVDQDAQNIAGSWPGVGLITQNSLNQSTVTAPIGDPLSLGTKVITPAATPFGNPTGFYDPNLKTQRSDQWTAGIEQGVGDDGVFSLYYAGSYNSHLHLSALQNTAAYPAAGTAAEVASRRPYPYITPTTYTVDNTTGNYNALQTTLKERTRKGLQYLLSYTWSKSMDVACSGAESEQCLLQNPADPRADYSVSGYDLTHIFSGSAVYELPVGRGRAFRIDNALADAAFGGWQVNAIVSLSSGTPYSVTVNGDIANIGNTFVQADLVGNPSPAHRSAGTWINPSAFASPARYTFGTFGRNALRSDWYKDADLSVFKTFPLVREAALEFRAEAFNVTNTPVFSAPNSVVGSPTFGAVSSTGNAPRQLQFALKLKF